MRSCHLFSALLKGDQFHAYVTAQAQNAASAFFNIPNLRKLERTLQSTITTSLNNQPVTIYTPERREAW